MVDGEECRYFSLPELGDPRYGEAPLQTSRQYRLYADQTQFAGRWEVCDTDPVVLEQYATVR